MIQTKMTVVATIIWCFNSFDSSQWLRVTLLFKTHLYNYWIVGRWTIYSLCLISLKLMPCSQGYNGPYGKSHTSTWILAVTRIAAQLCARSGTNTTQWKCHINCGNVCYPSVFGAQQHHSFLYMCVCGIPCDYLSTGLGNSNCHVCVLSNNSVYKI